MKRSSPKKNEQKSYPRFINTTPQGIDKFEGGSADLVAVAIENHIKDIEELEKLEKVEFRRIIGLEGKWGSGKSNIISILKDNIKNSHFLFEYDSWGHQEDLQRRSFLETLTDELIIAEDGGLLPEKCSRKLDNNKSETWKEKLKNLLARKKETISRNKPNLNKGVVGALIVFILTPIASIISNNDDFSIKIKVFVSLLPLISIFIFWVIYCIYKKEIVWSELFQIYSDDKLIDVVNETISEKEPSVKEFKDWMKDLSNDLTKPLIIVFDNMDRLPSEKVKQLWSSIHTFFAEENYGNIWVIITYDKKHLANAFGDAEEGEKKSLLSHFLSKTFPINYRVSPPVITDWKKLFKELFVEAFGEIGKDDINVIQIIFRNIKKDFTPRDMISFVNEMVALKKTWIQEAIPLTSIALFVLCKDDIVERPVESILTGSYLGPVDKIIFNNEDLQSHISALVYGVNINNARQIPLKKYISNCLSNNAGFDINAHTENTHFINILDEEIDDLNISNVENAILSLAKVKKEEIDLTTQWNKLVRLSMLSPLDFIFDEVNKSLLLYAGKKVKIVYVKFICSNYRKHDEFKGKDYFELINELEKFINEKQLEISISDYLQEKIVLPEDFIEFLEQAKNEYEKYKLICDSSKLNTFLSEKVIDNKFDFNFIRYLKEDKLYSFKDLQETIENEIDSDKIPLANLSNVIIAYKLISKEKPLRKQLSVSKIQQLINYNKDKESEAYFDTVAMSLAYQVTDVAYEKDLEINISKRLEFFKSYNDLLILVKDWNSELLRKSVKVMTENSIGTKLTITEILPHFEAIKNAINVDAILFLDELNEWKQEKKITEQNLLNQITYSSFYKYSAEHFNELTSHINGLAISELSKIDFVKLNKEQKNIQYWLDCACQLILGKQLKKLSENLIEFSKTKLVAISNGSETIPKSGDVIDVIINKAEKSKLQPTIKIIGINFCNNIINITPELFLYFEDNFSLTSKLKSREGDISSIILMTVINNPDVFNYILENLEKYALIINNSGDDAVDLKKEIKERYLKDDVSEQIEVFTSMIGIERNNEIEDV